MKKLLNQLYAYVFTPAMMALFVYTGSMIIPVIVFCSSVISCFALMFATFMLKEGRKTFHKSHKQYHLISKIKVTNFQLTLSVIYLIASIGFWTHYNLTALAILFMVQSILTIVFLTNLEQFKHDKK